MSKIIGPIALTASMFKPLRLVPKLMLEQTLCVTDKLSAKLSKRIWSLFEVPFCTSAEKPPIKSTPTASAALSKVLAIEI